MSLPCLPTGLGLGKICLRINIQDDVTTAFGGLLQVVEETHRDALGILLEVLVGEQRK